MIKILVVDDDSAVAKTIGLILGKSGYEVTTASHSIEAVALAFSVKPELIILDYGLPGMDGIKIYEGLKASKETCRIPVIFISGCAPKDIMDKAFEMGAASFILKPFNNDDLIDKVKKALGN